MTNEDAEFIEYLEQTLIPDLRESGRDATADDFVTMINMVQRIDPTVPMSGVRTQEPIMARIADPVPAGQQARNIWERLETLTRTAEQDSAVRQLLNGGIVMTTLDLGMAAGPYRFKEGHGSYLIFRDKSNQRWVINNQGHMRPAGSSEWEILS